VRLEVALTIAGMAIATYLTRAPLLLVLARRPLGGRVRLWLRLIPLAVLPALAVPLVLAPGGRLALAPWQPELWAAVTVFVLGALRANLLVAIAVSVAVVAVGRALGSG
jgi:branched-subunit amino acid transport protein